MFSTYYLEDGKSTTLQRLAGSISASFFAVCFNVYTRGVKILGDYFLYGGT
jgi:hypothetical protein